MVQRERGLRYGPLRKAVFDVIEGRVDEYTSFVPSTRLDANGLMNQAVLREVLVGDCNG